MKKKMLLAFVIVVCVIFVLNGVFYFVNLEKETEKQQERARIVQEYTNNKIAIFTEENNTTQSVQVAFLGDSLTDGYDVAYYYPQFSVTNRGIGGDTTFTLEKRLKVSVYDIHPEVVVMLIGANNIDTMFENYESILQQFKENIPDTEIVLLSLSAMGGEHWGVKNNTAILNNQKIKSLAVKYNYTFVDIFTPLCNVETGEIFEEYTTDGGHWTSLGYQVVTNTITPVLEKLLEQ